ncbi:MAG: UDP-N-acetylmuramate--L-alanine ligase [Elusimicrobia bacterium RIFOXYA2_FULL_39_19]|nr:MAG: UDP-N-acetylmuramate--L-alanine ligase [Elusimicrobia bacterium RIFOXYA2_FULL_39_19]
MFRKFENIHMVGIGGSGMSGIAEVLLNLGYNVSGSDMYATETTRHLEDLGAKIFTKHQASNIKNVDVVVTSTAIAKTNPEVLEVQKRKIPVIPRIEMLAEIARLKYTVGIAGTHGKTTTTSMTSLVLQYGGLDPTVVIGGRVKNFGSTGAKLGQGDFLVAEADESDGSFLKLSPAIITVTNIDDDHLDYYGTFEKLTASFIEYINKIPFYGFGILCVNNPVIKSILPKITRRYFTYGLNTDADYTAKNIEANFQGSCFDVFKNNKSLGRFELSVPGAHNVQNALSAICCGIELGIPIVKIKKALKDFVGVGRRLEIKGRIGMAHSQDEIIFIDDYGHHPTEVQATIKALRDSYKNKRIIAIFQPHRYTRTKILYKKFGKVFGDADLIRLCEIYPASEKPIKGVSSKLILNEAKKHKNNIEMFNFEKLVKEIKPGDVVLTLGAGDVWKLNGKIQEQLKLR